MRVMHVQADAYAKTAFPNVRSLPLWLPAPNVERPVLSLDATISREPFNTRQHGFRPGTLSALTPHGEDGQKVQGALVLLTAI